MDKRKYKLELHDTGLHMRSLLLVMLIPTIASAQLRVSTDGHYLYEKQTGQPVFLNGESVWCLFTAITYTQADDYFQNCQQYGVNFLQTCLIEDGFTQTSSGWGSPNTNGHRPFIGNTFTNRNLSYFTHCDSIIGLAKRYGIYIHAYISYLGAGSYEGWQTEIGASSITDMKSWGDYIGNRYKDSTNIMWGISGDCVPTPWQQKLDSMSIALLARDTNHLLVPRDNPWTVTQTHWSGRPWLKLEYIYPYWGPQEYNPERIYAAGWTAYNSNRPAFLEEAWYENEAITNFPTNEQLRQQMYYGPLSGAFVGQVFGNCPIWHFGAGHNSVCGSGTYQSWLDSPGHVSVGWCGKLFRNRNWWTLIPDQSGTVLTAGASTGANRAVCAYTADSTTIIVYMPSSRQVTVTSARLKGDSTHAWWFNPANGSTIDLGIQTRAPHNYTPTAGDWILVLDAKIMNYPPPGVEVSVTPPAPLLMTPINGATGVETNATLTWNPSAGATSYRVQVSIDSGFATTFIDQSNIAATSFAMSGLSTATTYYWRVNATNNGGTSDFSIPWKFTTIQPPPPPATPVLTTPANGSTGVAMPPTLMWNPSTGAESYRVQVSSDSGFGTAVVDQDSIMSTSYVVDGLSAAATYYWRVNAANAGGTSGFSTVWGFTTAQPPPPPAAPVLVTPANGAIGVPTTPTLIWSGSAEATSYRLQVASDSLFSSTFVDDSTLTDTLRHVGSLSGNTGYFWHVRAKNIGGASPWSPYWRFTTAVTITRQIVMTSGWNLICVPLTVDDARKSTLFPTAVSPAFTYIPGLGLQPRDTLLNGLGYWLKFPSSQDVSILGSPIPIDTIPVVTGWNLIGSISTSLDTSEITEVPPGILASRYFRYSQGYVFADSVLVGSGYWVKVNAPGVLLLITPTELSRSRDKLSSPRR